MKYVIIIPGGAADLPIPDLGDKTPLEAAHLPNLARLAEIGRVGIASTTPHEFEPASDVCSLSLLGYDPSRYHTGLAPLEAAALAIQSGPRDFIFRLDLVTTGQPGSSSDGLMLDHSAGDISDREARVLVSDLLRFWRHAHPNIADTLAIFPDAGSRHILVDTSGRDFSGVVATPPHAILGEPWRDFLPEGGSADAAAVLNTLVRSSAEFLPSHEVNLARTESGLRPATMAWIWGHGVRPAFPSFLQRFALRGAMISSVDLLAGIASCIGWARLPVHGLTSSHDTDYLAQGQATCDAIEHFDLVCSHIPAPDHASLQGDWKTKVASLEMIDKAIIGPVIERLRTYGDPEKNANARGWRVLVMPDHYTLCSTRKHDATPVPFVIAGSWVRSAVKRRMIESDALSSDLRIDEGHELMEYFLRGGLAAVKVR